MNLPRYRCHKEVSAVKIAAIDPCSGPANDGGAMIQPAEAAVSQFHVSAEFLRKHKPEPGGYFVRYSDGYSSFSPAAAFEEGYTRIA